MHSRKAPQTLLVFSARQRRATCSWSRLTSNTKMLLIAPLMSSESRGYNTNVLNLHQAASETLWLKWRNRILAPSSRECSHGDVLLIFLTFSNRFFFSPLHLYSSALLALSSPDEWRAAQRKRRNTIILPLADLSHTYSQTNTLKINSRYLGYYRAKHETREKPGGQWEC